MSLKKDFYLGIDTSAYTTSLAIVDQDEKLILDRRAALTVKEGSLGLRQSDAVFEHIKKLPELLREEENFLMQGNPVAIAVSTRPRPVANSYMPVFKVSEAFGLFLSRTMGLYFLASSHQEGHILAGLWSAGLPQGRFVVIHFSGGTSDIIVAEEVAPGQLIIDLVGGSNDLKAGQFIDRLGQTMGLGFPAGVEMEKLARKSGEALPRLPLAVKGLQISFSGPASHAERLLKKGCNRENLARAVEICIADSICSAINNMANCPGDFHGLLAVGGVMANKFIRSQLLSRLSGWKLSFAEPQLSTDSAVGLAVQAVRHFRSLARPKQ